MECLLQPLLRKFMFLNFWQISEKTDKFNSKKVNLCEFEDFKFCGFYYRFMS